MNELKIIAIVQARTGSTRFPNKVFCNLSGKPLIWHVFNRLSYSKRITKSILATTNSIKDHILEKWAIANNIDYFRGDENNVLKRYYDAAIEFSADVIIRITSDDPFKDPIIIDDLVYFFENNSLDFAYNNNPVSFPEGLDVEIFTMDALSIANKKAKSSFEKEHVTQFFHLNNSLFKMKNFLNVKNYSYLRWTIDTEVDYEMVKIVYMHLYKNGDIFYFEDILKLIKDNPTLSKINSSVKRSLMYKKN
jgi:spore coat polysaccharide biosynthesis protein SpsF